MTTSGSEMEGKEAEGFIDGEEKEEEKTFEDKKRTFEDEVGQMLNRS